MTEGSGETRLSDQIAYHRSLCDAATPGSWYEVDTEDASGLQVCAGPVMDAVAALPHGFDNMVNNASFIAAHSPDVVSALLDVVEAAAQVQSFIVWVIESMHPSPGIEPELLRRAKKESLVVGASLAALSQRMEERPVPAQPEEAP